MVLRLFFLGGIGLCLGWLYAIGTGCSFPLLGDIQLLLLTPLAPRKRKPKQRLMCVISKVSTTRNFHWSYADFLIVKYRAYSPEVCRQRLRQCHVSAFCIDMVQKRSYTQLQKCVCVRWELGARLCGVEMV